MTFERMDWLMERLRAAEADRDRLAAENAALKDAARIQAEVERQLRLRIKALIA